MGHYTDNPRTTCDRAEKYLSCYRIQLQVQTAATALAILGGQDRTAETLKTGTLAVLQTCKTLLQFEHCDVTG